MLKKQSSHLWVITLVLLILWGIFLFRLDEPFFGHHESGNTWIASAVRTYNQYGSQATNFLPIRTQGPTTPETGEYYLNHPPLIVWFVGIATQFFGYYPDTLAPFEASVRMVGIIVTTLTLPLFYVMVRRLTNPTIALIAFSLYATAPVTIYFSRMPYYDMVVMPMILTFSAIFINWMREYSIRRTVYLTICGIVIMWTAWAGAFYLAVFGVIALIYGSRQQRMGIIVVGIITGFATILIPITYEILRPGTIDHLIETVTLRTSNQQTDFSSQAFTARDFLLRYINHMIIIVSIAVTLLGAMGIGILLRRKKTLNVGIMLGWIVAPFIFMLLVRNSFHFHDWYKLHFLPGFAIASALVIYHGWRLPPDGIRRYAKPFIFAIILVSTFVNVYWIYGFHQTTFDEFARSMSEELPLHTEENDLITSNITRSLNKIEYNAYRNITWGILPETLQAYYDEQNEVDMYYILCLTPEMVNTYDGLFSELDYYVIAGECRLIHIVK